MKNETTRRDFIRQVSLAGALLGIPAYLLSCNSCKEEGDQTAGESLIKSASVPFGIWRQMIEALEKSPDHLTGRRKALITSKDPKAMTDFVRDHLQVLPQIHYFLRYADRNIIYGAEGALRSGLATPREKAEILKDMLVQAGFEARVMLESIDFTEEELKNIVFRSYRPEFNPAISKDQMKSWQKALGAAAKNGTVKEMVDSEKSADLLYKRLSSEIREDFDYSKFGNDFRAPQGGAIPLVVYTLNGEQKYAHVFDPSVPAGSLHPKNKKQTVNNAPEITPQKNDISIELSYRSALEPSVEKSLIAGNWDLQDLIGSTISLQFLNNMDFKTQTTSTISQIKSFTPAFAFQKIGAPREYMEKHSVLGEPINLSGKEILKKEDTESQEVPAKINVPGKTDRIVDLKIMAIPLAFPQTRVELFPTDSTGKIVEGLTAANFILTDNKNSVAGHLEKNVISPKVMVLYDTSGSMPQEYRFKKSMDQFTNDLKSVVHDLYPAAVIHSQPTGSDIYTSLLSAKQSDYDLIMYATDGDNNDKFDPQHLEVYNAGQPMLILEVISKSHTYEELKKNITNLISIPAVDRNEVKEEIKTILSKLTFPPYVLTYSSFGEEDEHVVNVTLNDKKLGAETRFKFPEPNDLYLGDRMVGLYLTLKGKDFSVRRTLAGWDHEISPYKSMRSHIDEVHEMFLGGAVMAFEGEAPSLSIRLTDYLSAQLSNEKWFNAQKEGKTENAVQFLEEGILSYQPLLLSMMQPLSEVFSKDSITFPNGFRSCIIKMNPALYSKESQLSFDYLPTSNYLTFSRTGDGKLNFTQNLKNTTQLAILESEMFQDSTITQLKDKKIIELVKARKNSSFNSSLPRELDVIFYNRIFRGGELTFFDESLTSKAYFKINNNTGELYAYLPDGTGGGGNSVEAQLKELDRVVAAYSQIVSMMQLTGGINGGIGILVTYSITLIKLYAYASEAIIVMDASKLDAQVAKALQSLACSVFTNIIYVGPTGERMGGIESLIGAMGGEFSFFSC